MTVQEVIALAKSNDVKMVDLKFCDIHGAWQHFTIPVTELTEAYSKMDSDLTDPVYVGGRAYRPRHVGPARPNHSFL